jgi:copper chaperone CopZ
MEQRLVVMGMTCTGCQKTVTEKITALPGVEEVSVTLESGLTVIQSKRVLSEKEVSDAMGSKYSVQNQNTIQVGEPGHDTPLAKAPDTTYNELPMCCLYKRTIE